MELRPYIESDRDACVAIFDSNAPEFFDPGSRGRFEGFLDQPRGNYFVMVHDSAVAGCGGYVAVPGENVASLVWGMVRRDLQRLGLGRFLLMYRLLEIGKLNG